MSVLEFVSATISQVAWPLCIFAAALVLRRPLGSLFTSPRLTHLKAGPGGLEFELRAELADAAHALDVDSMAKSPDGTEGRPSRVEPPPKPKTRPELGIEMEALLDANPRALIIERWLQIERLLRDDIPKALPEAMTRLLTAERLIDSAHERGRLTDAQAAVMHDLRRQRDRVVHLSDEPVSMRTALQYAQIANQLMEAYRAT